jgi:hypothetical protein
MTRQDKTSHDKDLVEPKTGVGVMVMIDNTHIRVFQHGKPLFASACTYRYAMCVCV